MIVSALCGSLRNGSYNQMLLDTAAERCARFDLDIVQAQIRDFPLFMQELEATPPPSVTEAKRIIGSSACLLLVTPEHNFTIPGVLKNAVDWLSRPKGDDTLRARPMALMGASTGYMGTIRAQLAWRQSWQFFNQPVFSGAEMTLSFAATMTADGRVTDENALQRLDDYLGKLSAWLQQLLW